MADSTQQQPQQASRMTIRPKVLSLTSNQLRMGDLTCANTKFELKAAPRVSKIQAALFTDKRQ